MKRRAKSSQTQSFAAPEDRAMIRLVAAISIAATALLTLGMLSYVRFIPPLLARLDVQIGEVLMREGMRFEAAGAVENAKERYLLALQARFAGPQNRAHTLKHLGTLLWAEGDAAGAIPYLREAADSPHAPVTVYEPLADALLQLGRGAEAEAVIVQWRKVLEAQPDHEARASAEYYLGRIARDRGDRDAAERHFAAAHELQPGGRGTAELAVLYYESKRYAETIAAIDQCLQAGVSGARADYLRQVRAIALRRLRR